MHRHDEPTPAPKLLGSRGLRLRLAGGGLLFLVVGAAVAPTARHATLSPSEERPAPLLDEQAQQRLAVPPFRGVGDVADLTRLHGVTLSAPQASTAAVWSDYASAPRLPPASGFGVFVSDSLALTHADALGGRLTADVSTVDGRTLEATVAAYDMATELVLLSVPGALAAPATLGSSPVKAGTLGAGVVHQQGRDLVLPVFVTSLDGERLALADASTWARPGLPIYTLDGELVAVSGSAGVAEAIAVTQATARLLAQEAGQGPPASLGIAVQEIPALLRPSLGETGALISHVIPGGPADRAGIEPGQVVNTVDELDVSTPQTMATVRSALRVDTPALLTLGVNGRAVHVEVLPASTYEVAALARAASSEVASGVHLRDLFSQADLSGARLPPDALVQRIGDRRVTSRAEALREVRRARRPLSLYLYHDGTWFFAGLELSR